MTQKELDVINGMNFNVARSLKAWLDEQTGDKDAIFLQVVKTIARCPQWAGTESWDEIFSAARGN